MANTFTCTVALGNQAHETNSFSFQFRFPPDATTTEIKILACSEERITYSRDHVENC
jgi:hypothetical protein